MRRNTYRSSRGYDHPYDCDICGQRYYRSECTKLGKYTAHPGAIVCKNCVEPIDWTQVPFIPRKERSPRDVSDLMSDTTNSADPVSIDDIES